MANTPAQLRAAQAEQTYHRDLQKKGRGARHRKAGRTIQVQAMLRRLASEGIR